MSFLKGALGSNNKPLTHNVVITPGEVEEAIRYMPRPGRIDLSGLTFTALSDEDETDDEIESVIDVAVFPLLHGCDDNTACDLSMLGIGKREVYDGMSFLSLCHDGRLWVDTDNYVGFHTSLTVPAGGDMDKHLKFGLVAFEHAKRDYEVIIANCNREGRSVRVVGQVEFAMSVDPSTAETTYEPIPYPVISICVFLFCTLCFFRISCNTRASYWDARYQAVQTDGRQEETPSS